VSGADFGIGALSAQYVAKKGVEGMLKGKKTIVPSLLMKGGRFVSKLIPEALSVRILYKVQFAKKKD
jgi:short-subunit dehydrogenase